MERELMTSIVRASNNARQLLSGCTVRDVRYMTPQEANDLGWYKVGLIIWLESEEDDEGNTNTIQLIVQQDDEGNDSGVLNYVVTDKKNEIEDEGLFYSIHI